MSFVWSEEAIEKTRLLLLKGKSASQIAAALGASRNAVIGKVKRVKHLAAIGLKGKSFGGKGKRRLAAPKVKPQKQSLRPANIAGKREGRNHDPEYRKPRQTINAAEAHAYDAAAPRLSLLDLSRTSCRWPIGDPHAPGFAFCGHTALPECSYCRHHQDRASGGLMRAI